MKYYLALQFLLMSTCIFAQNFRLIEVNNYINAYLVNSSTIYLDLYEKSKVPILKSSDLGESWEKKVTCPLGYKIFISEDTSVFVAYYNQDFLYRTFDGWNSYDSVKLSLFPKGFEDISYANNTLFISYFYKDTNTKFQQTTYKSNDFGNTWSLYYELALKNIKFIDSNLGYAEGANDPSCGLSKPFIAKTKNGGKDWQIMNSLDNTTSTKEVEFYKKAIYGYRSKDVPSKTYDDGNTWIDIRNGLPKVFYNVNYQFINDSVGFISGYNELNESSIYWTSNYGDNWYLLEKIPNKYKFIRIFEEGNDIYLLLYNKTLSDLGFLLAKFDILKFLSLNSSHPEIFSLNIFPNPSIDYVTINLPDKIKTNYNYKIIDVNGNIRLKNNNINPSVNRIEISTLPKGLYFLILYSEGDVFTQKVIKTSL